MLSAHIETDVPVTSGNTLLKSMVGAIPEAIAHRRAFEEFDAHLRRDKPDQLQEWDREYAEWDKQPRPSPCLFDTKERCMYSLTPLLPAMDG